MLAWLDLEVQPHWVRVGLVVWWEMLVVLG